MLALGLVRAAERTLISIEPQLLRSCELLHQLDPARPAAAARGELHQVDPARPSAAARSELDKLFGELARTLANASFEGQPLFDGGSRVFDVEDVRRNGEPLTVCLPDLGALLHGHAGLGEFLARKRTRSEAEAMTSSLRSGLAEAKVVLHEAAQQLSVLLTHFHRQRSDRPPTAALDLARTAARLSERVLRAGSEALAAQGELSTRASSLVLNERAT